jgi:hypothetical protein
MLLVTLIGWQVGSVPGALVATAAMCLPSCTLTYFAARVWQRFRGASWRHAVEAWPRSPSAWCWPPAGWWRAACRPAGSPPP